MAREIEFKKGDKAALRNTFTHSKVVVEVIKKISDTKYQVRYADGNVSIVDKSRMTKPEGK